MSRRNRQCPPGLPVHIVQRGNNRQVCFAADADLKAYANWLCEAAHRYGVDVHAWVFMSNHVHLLLTPHADDSISKCMQYLGLGTTGSTRRAAYRALFTERLEADTLSDIRKALNTGLVLGNDRFRGEVERLTGQRQTHLKRGPKPKCLRPGN